MSTPTSKAAPVGDDEALRRAKRPLTPIAGPYGHPFHALAVTVPIGTWVGAVIFDIAATAGAGRGYRDAAGWLILIGLIGAVIAAALGLMDLSRLRSGTRARRVALIHMTINLSVVVLFVVNLIVRVNSDGMAAPLTLDIIAIVALGVSGALGGELSYRYGVRVADEETQRAAYAGARRA
jgi:uncharacterized membrane protein